MSVGVLMLLHAPFGRAADIVRHWVGSGVPVVVHIDKKSPQGDVEAFKSALADLSERVRYSKRFVAEWGRWGLVQATLEASRLLLSDFKEVSHVLLTSGSCLPLRPVSELEAYIAERPGVEFIESARTSEVSWTMGGLSAERFTLYFPFSWRKQRVAFDYAVRLQRRLKVKRSIPEDLEPHMGSQWWCLTRQTLERIFADPRLKEYSRYFRATWIPDESFFQTLVRSYNCKVQSTSLTLAKFDKHGKPAVFYDDHFELLRRSNCFVARKIWHKADRLYESFLAPQPVDLERGAPNPSRIDRIFALAGEQRERGRTGLYMQSRFPLVGREKGLSAAPYTVLEGLDYVFEDFEHWLRGTIKARVHGHLFAEKEVEFAGRVEIFRGGLSNSAALRDYNPGMFLTSLLWNARSERQVFFFGPLDRQKVSRQLSEDGNAQIFVISGAWILPLMAENLSLETLRRRVGRLQNIEDAHLSDLRAQVGGARVRVWSLAELLHAPHLILSDIFAAAEWPPFEEPPRVRDFSGLPEVLSNLRNLGLHPFLMGDTGLLVPDDEGTVFEKAYDWKR